MYFIYLFSQTKSFSVERAEIVRNNYNKNTILGPVVGIFVVPVGILSWTRDTNVVVNEENILVLLATCQTSHLPTLRLGPDNASLPALRCSHFFPAPSLTHCSRHWLAKQDGGGWWVVYWQLPRQVLLISHLGRGLWKSVGWSGSKAGAVSGTNLGSEVKPETWVGLDLNSCQPCHYNLVGWLVVSGDDRVGSW